MRLLEVSPGLMPAQQGVPLGLGRVCCDPSPLSGGEGM